MDLPYLNETIDSPDGIPCAVLDGARVDFTLAVQGRKRAETLVRRAMGGESIVTRSNKDGKIESTYTACKGDAIFINLNNPDDIYVPGNPDGTRWKFSELKTRGYRVVARTPDGVRVKVAQSFPILHEVVKVPTCIKDAWGKGKHQFIFEGASLKLNDNGNITSIDKTAFDATWETLTPPAGP